MSTQHNRPRPDAPDGAGRGIDAEARRRSVRRTVLWLALLAVAIYAGFIALSIVRGS